jgi:hypothetical protein
VSGFRLTIPSIVGKSRTHHATAFIWGRRHLDLTGLPHKNLLSSVCDSFLASLALGPHHDVSGRRHLQSHFPPAALGLRIASGPLGRAGIADGVPFIEEEVHLVVIPSQLIRHTRSSHIVRRNVVADRRDTGAQEV